MKNSWLFILLFLKYCDCNSQIGPDPWDYEIDEKSQPLSNNFDTPSDLRTVIKNDIYKENRAGMGEWFYKRILAIVLKGGKVQIHEDDTIHVSLQMRFDQERWTLLNEYIATNNLFTENMFRRSVGYIEESICKPSIAEQITMAWTEYIEFYLTKYKIELTWILTIITMKVTLIWLWRYISHKHILILLFVVLYFYEGFVSYKEAEQQEVERFLSAVNKCKWYIWASDCEIPPPDPLIFLKHMNPLKIGIRMFTILISEPIIVMSETIKTIIHGITDGLWYPLDRIMYVILIVIFIVLLIFLLLIIMFNYILNIPFKLNFMGLISVGLKQRNRHFINKDNNQSARVDTIDRISGATLNRILDVCSRALSTAEVKQSGNNTLQLTTTMLPQPTVKNTSLRRSASTGRLTSLGNELYVDHEMLALENNYNKNKIKRRVNGGGDACLSVRFKFDSNKNII